MQDLSVSIVQTELHWHQPEKNRAQFEQIIQSLKNKTHLIVLPEMFTTGFTMEAVEQAESMEGETVQWMQSMAQEANATIMGSVIIEDDEHYYNRLIGMPPDGHYWLYDKRHLFRMAKEHEHFSAGTHTISIELQGWKICPLICYDLRFPVWSRNRDHYDLLIYVANWPERRRTAWQTLLKARAIENLSYVVGVNRVGQDQNGIDYSGDSAIVDFMGNELACKAHEPFIETVHLSHEKLQAFRKKFPADQDADDFELL